MPKKNQGFALIIALSLMAFILLLVISISSLVQVENRNAGTSLRQLNAEQAALLGLQIALGELQKNAGPDQRVTATAQLIVDGSGASTAASQTQYYTGVWNTESGRFNKWLASVADASGQLDPDGLTQEADVNVAPSGPKRMVLQTTATRPADDVVVDQVSIGTDSSYAYWVSDEGVKAKVDLVADEEYYQALTDGDVEDLDLRVPLGAAPSIGFELLDDLSGVPGFDKRTDPSFRAKLRNLASIDDFELLGAEEAKISLLHPDITTFSYGLLTNPKSGGLKEDLSLAFEHGLKDSGHVFVEKGYAHPDGSMDVKGPTWSVFQDHYNLYKQMDFSDGIPQLETTDPRAHGGLDDSLLEDFYEFRDDYHEPMKDPVLYSRPLNQKDNQDRGYDMPYAEAVQVSPVFLGNMVIVSLKIEPSITQPTKKRLVTVLQPIALMWNPYNVEIETSDDMNVRTNMIFGLEFRFRDPVAGSVYKGRAKIGELWSKSGIALNANYSGVDLMIGSGEVFAPGEIKLYSTNQVGATSDKLPAVDQLFNSNGAGYHITGWRKLSPKGTGSANYEDISRKNYTPDEILVDSLATEIDIALSPMFANHDLSGLYLDAGSGDIQGKPFYQKRHVKPLLLREGEYTQTNGYPEGTFSAAEESGAEKVGIGFVNFNIPASSLNGNTIPVGIFFNTAVSSDDVNNGLQTPSAMELHLSSNPRTPFCASTVGTYAHFKNHPNIVYEAQEFLGQSTLDGLFYDDQFPHFGMSYSNSVGQHRPVAWEFPLSPLTSIAQLQHVFFNRDSYEPSYAVGNSFASPYLKRDESISTVEADLKDNGIPPISNSNAYQNWTGSAIDYSYKLNEALWDEYFFSSLAPVYEEGSEEQGLAATIDGFLDGTQALPNRRMQRYLAKGVDANDLATDLKSRNADRSSKKVAAHLLVEGAFNVNSTSVQAWKAFLGSLYKQDVVGMELGDSASGGGENLEMEATPAGAVFSRFSLPTLDESHPSDNSEIQNNQGSGYRVLDADELDALAVKVVEQVKLRGPFRSLADFVNRELSTGDTGLMGPLQKAINAAGLNNNYTQGLTVNKGGSVPTQYQHDIFLDPGAGTGNSYGAGPGYLLQGDILNSLGPFLTVKSNTFVVRSCGESVDPISGQTTRVYLEAVVQQVPDFVDPADDASTPLDALSSVANQQFGRQFKLVKLRRLAPEQI